MKLRAIGCGLCLALGIVLPASALAGSDVVISQVYGGGGNSGATYRNDFIELFNRGSAPVLIDGWSVQYASSTGTTWQVTALTGTLAPGQYYLVQEAQGAGGTTNLPTPDATGTIPMSATAGKVVLVATNTAITSGTACPTGPDVVDVVGFGSGTNCSETAPTATLSNTTAALRKNNGAQDTDNNGSDFATGAPTPRNSTTTSAIASITATDPSAAEAGSDAGSFTVSRIGGNTAQALVVSYTVSGSATNGVDYTPTLTSSVTIPANQSSTTIVITPVDDAAAEGTETAILTLAAGSGYSIDGSAAVATVTIADNDAPDTAPSVASTTPANAATGIAIASPVTVVFGEQVNVAAGAVSVECPAGTTVASNPAALVNVDRVTLSPAPVWPVNTTCRVAVTSSGVTDVDVTDPPDSMAANYVGTFSTIATACTAADTPIGQIQGTGTSAALTGVRTVQGVVVADYEGADPALRGFYLQDTGAGADGNPLTSDGIFIFNNNANSVSVGQVVQVTGNVSEYGFNSTGGTQTQITAATIEACGATGTVTPVDITLPLAATSDYEKYEGMLVRFPQALYVTEHFQLGRFGQVLLSSGARLSEPTSIVAPGAPALAQSAANLLNQIMLDDDLQQQNPDPIRFGRGGNPLTAANTLRGGDTVTALQGVLTQTDATTAANVPATSDPVRYRLRPFNVLNQVTPQFVAANPRPASPALDAANVRVAGFNLLNYFNTFGAGACTNGVGGTVTDCRGADSQAEFDRQTAKTVPAAIGTQADVLVVNEIENDGYSASSAIADLVTRLNAATAPGTYAFINADALTGQTNALGVDAIKVGMIYKPARVTPVGTTAAANTGAFGLFTTTGGLIQRSRPALAQAFQQNGTSARFVVVANHLKSKGSDCVDNVSPVGSDPDAGDGQGNCNLTRLAAAQQLVTWLAGNPTGTGSGNTLIMGDLNAYAKEDPIAALTGAGYVNLVASRLGADAYSYVFDGEWGYLDHALASPALNPQVRAVTDWHINADEPSVLDYNTNFKSAGQVTSLYAADAFRTSDHDVVMVDIALDTDGDGLPDSREVALGTNPLDADSDDDGLADGVEDANHNGVVDPGERDPRSADTDGDGIQDGTESGITVGVADPDGAGPLLGTNLAVFVPDANPATTTSATNADTDGDGFSDGVEDANHNGAIDPGESDPNSASSVPPGHVVPLLPLPGLVVLALLLTAVAGRATGTPRRRMLTPSVDPSQRRFRP